MIALSMQPHLVGALSEWGSMEFWDATQDGIINGDDLSFVLNAWGDEPSPIVMIPVCQLPNFSSRACARKRARVPLSCAFNHRCAHRDGLRCGKRRSSFREAVWGRHNSDSQARTARRKVVGSQRGRVCASACPRMTGFGWHLTPHCARPQMPSRSRRPEALNSGR